MFKNALIAVYILVVLTFAAVARAEVDASMSHRQILIGASVLQKDPVAFFGQVVVFENGTALMATENGLTVELKGDFSFEDFQNQPVYVVGVLTSLNDNSQKQDMFGAPLPQNPVLGDLQALYVTSISGIEK